MQKTLRAAMGKYHEVTLYEVTFTAGTMESSVYVVIKKMTQSNETISFDQYDTEVKAQRKFARLANLTQ